MSPRCDNDPGRTFRPDVKCCGYTPTTPNFQVGAVLAGRTMDEGLQSMRARIAAKRGVTPLGIMPSNDYIGRWKAAPFGSERELRCPHYVQEGGLCGVWRHREAVCTTWFCQLERGVVGQHFWMTLRKFLFCAQDALVRHCARELGAVEGAQGVWGWGRWKKRVPAYYQECWQIVGGMHWKEVRQLGGFELGVRARDLKAAHHERRNPVLPTRLRRGEFRQEVLDDGAVRLWGWGAWASVDVTVQELAVINGIDEAGSEEVLADGKVSRQRLQEWVDQRVIVGSGDAG